MTYISNNCHCPECGAKPLEPCVGLIRHMERMNNDWRVEFDDALQLHRVVFCHDRKSRDMIAEVMQSAGMLDIRTHDRMVRRKNLLGGWFIEAEDTPLHLSPASETYHSM